MYYTALWTGILPNLSEVSANIVIQSKSEIQITQHTVFCQKKLLFEKYRTKNELESHMWA